MGCAVIGVLTLHASSVGQAVRTFFIQHLLLFLRSSFWPTPECTEAVGVNTPQSVLQPSARTKTIKVIRKLSSTNSIHKMEGANQLRQQLLNVAVASSNSPE